MRKTSEGPVGAGTTTVWIGRFLGRSYESPSEYTDFVVNKRIIDKTTSGPFHLEIETTLDSVDGGTRITALHRGESHGFFKLAEPVVIRLATKQFETAYENLKELLEAGAL